MKECIQTKQKMEGNPMSTQKCPKHTKQLFFLNKQKNFTMKIIL